MSDINLDFTVSNNSINFTVAPNDITITPTDIQLNIAQGGVMDTATGLNSNISNVHISGGSPGYVLATYGNSSLYWSASAGGGNGSPGGANTFIQYNDSGLFGGSTGFTFDKTTGDVNMPANLSVVGNISGSFTVANANYANYAGNVVNSTQSNITAIGNLSALNVVGTTSIQQAQEKVTSNSTGSTGTINYDLLTQAILYKTGNASANFTINFRGNSTTTLDSIMSSNQSMTCTLINTNGSTGYIANVFQIDGNTITPNWLGGSAPTIPTPNGKDMYNFNILKTAANTFVVFGSTGGYY